MSEKAIERYLSTIAKRLGGKSYKWVSPGYVGVPDRIVLLPVAPEHREIVAKYIKFVELKDAGQRPTNLQFARLDELCRLGFDACWSDTKEGIDAILAP